MIIKNYCSEVYIKTEEKVEEYSNMSNGTYVLWLDEYGGTYLPNLSIPRQWLLGTPACGPLLLRQAIPLPLLRSSALSRI